MRIHHLNCGCMCPLGGRLIDGFSRGLTAQLVCHCLALETNAGVVLVDTGFARRDMLERGGRLPWLARVLNNISFDPVLTAVHGLRELGIAPRDVRHIVLTHLDFDHASGLEDFPEARVHVLQEEMDAARSTVSLLGRLRYRPALWSGVPTGVSTSRAVSLGSASVRCGRWTACRRRC